MNNTIKYIKELYALPFRLFAVVMRIFHLNRMRLDIWMSKPGVSRSFKLLVVFTALVWLAIALISGDDENNRLTQAMQQFWDQQTQDSSVVPAINDSGDKQ